jgi:hypothetical protein
MRPRPGTDNQGIHLRVPDNPDSQLQFNMIEIFEGQTEKPSWGTIFNRPKVAGLEH